MTTAQYITTTALADQFAALKQARFSGRLLLKASLEQEWTFYLYLGRIIYATGGVHSVRRWQRNLAIYCPQVDLRQPNLPRNLANPWEYQLLCWWVKQQQTNREQISQMIRAVVAEVLFDITQATQVMHQAQPDPEGTPLLPQQLVLIDTEQAIAQAQKDWQTWQTANITDLLPNRAPVIKRPEELQHRTSAATYQTLTTLLSGQLSLRDLAVQMKRQAVEVTRSLLPFIQLGVIELIEIPDLAAPVSPAIPLAPPAQSVPQGPLIACVDDSPLVCQTMEQILTGAGYQFVAVQDSLRAIATLLSRKPALIFLDLVMPNTNGYEICSQLRKVSAFRDTPIIILTGNDGIIDRVRAKVVGSSDFLSKPVDAETLLSTLRKHLIKTGSPTVS